jgi:hypothetical protein
MTIKLFTDSDTYLEFSSRGKAFSYVGKQGLTNWMLLSINSEEEIRDIQDNSDDNVTIHKASVFNPFLKQGDHGCVEWFHSEEQAMKYIGSFL